MRHHVRQKTSASGGRPRRLALAAALATAACVFAMPATAEDNPPAPGPAGGCSFLGGTLPAGTVINRAPGLPPLPGTFGQPGQYVCINGQWVWIGFIMGPGGPIFMEAGPSVTAADATVVVPEGATATNSGTFSYAGTGPVSLSSAVGAVTNEGNGTWSWSYPTTDGPSQSGTMIVTGTADAKVGGTAFALTVDNVAPTVASVTAGTTAAVVGQPVTFHGTATDPSTEDALAGFDWTFAGAAVAGDTYTTSFSQCGAGTVTATATDKDGGTSAVATSDAVAVVEAQVAAPLQAGSYNLVQSGQVVPLRVEIGCDGVQADGLSPAIQVLSGDVDAATDSGDPTLTVATTDASGADTSNVLRQADGAYLYNLRVPSAPADTLFTVRVRPFADSPDALYVVLKIRR